jgi:hypothetical protein
MSDEKRIPVTYRSTGKVLYSQPVPRHQLKRPELEEPKNDVLPDAVVMESGAGTDPNKSMNFPRAAGEAIHDVLREEMAKTGVSGKPKMEIETLEHFIIHAYGLKGRRVTLKKKVEQRIAANLTLSEDALLRLSQLTLADKLFAVPRQLLLVCRDIHGNPGLRNALHAFVRDVMLRHSLFKAPALDAAVRNLPEAPAPADAVALALVDAAPSQVSEEPALKPAEQITLRTNAAYCLVVWLAEVKELSLEKVIEVVNASLWAPSAGRIGQESAKLRALTEIEQVEGIGLACEYFRHRASDNKVLAERATHEAAALRERIAQLERELGTVAGDLVGTQKELKQVRIDSEATLIATTTAAEIETAHLRDDMEQLRSRILRRLVADVDQLEVGLSALRGTEPRIHVIQDRVERVLDTLRAEINKLKEG